jgi:hypothetical protein
VLRALSVNPLESETLRLGRVSHPLAALFGASCLGVLAWLVSYCAPVVVNPSTPPLAWWLALAELPAAAVATLCVLPFLGEQIACALQAWLSPSLYLRRTGKG